MCPYIQELCSNLLKCMLMAINSDASGVCAVSDKFSELPPKSLLFIDLILNRLFLK